MPITFRCSACDRMLSVARRKAGTQVGCPKCGKMISVPAAAGVAVQSNPAAQKLDAMPLFERSDFESLLNPSAKSSERPKPPALKEESKPHPVPAPVPVPYPLPVAMSAPAFVPQAVKDDGSGEADVLAVEGMVVTKQKLWIAAAVVVVLLIISFAVGYFIATSVGKKKETALTHFEEPRT